MMLRRTRVEGALCLYAVSGLWGAWTSYDATAAARLLGLLCGALLLFYVLALMPAQISCRGTGVPLLRIVVGATPALLACYFALTHDWSRPADKVAWLEPIRTWLAGRPHAARWPQVHANVVGGVLAMWLPLQAAALFSRRSRDRSARPRVWPAFLGVLSLGLSCLGLLLSGLRGSWLALAAALAFAGWWRLAGTLTRRRGLRATLALWVAGAAAVGALVAFTPLGPQVLALRPDRVQVWRNSWDLACDYPFTGLGLGAYTMAYSSYALLVHVPHTTHAHNLPLDIWLAQGLGGVVAFAWLTAASLAAVARIDNRSRWRDAASVSLLVLLLHGLVDDAYYGYGAIGLPALFVPFALLARDRPGAPVAKTARASARRWVAAGAAAVLAATLGATPAVRAQFEANLGAWRQTRAELSVYRWPQWPLQDALRRSDDVDLAPALQSYRAALAIDPGNVTANRRLGQVELSRGQYEQSLAHLGSAYRGAPGQRATRQLFGESLAVTGDVAGGAALWRAVPAAEDQFAIRRFWYEHIGDATSAERVGAAAELAAR